MLWGGDTIAGEQDKVIVKNWPFKQNEEAMLYWIDDPYLKDKKWMIDAYFKGDTEIKMLTFDWATVHFLACGRYYTNGNLNNENEKSNSSEIKGEVVEDIVFRNIEFKIIEDSIQIGNKRISTNIFVGYKNGIKYRIPAVEIIRATIANSQFLLNRIVEMDSLPKYFVHMRGSDGKLFIDFSDEYEEELLKKVYIRHLAWIITNENILKMFNQVGKNLKLYGELKCDFLFDKLNIKARIRKNSNNVVRVREIVAFKKKKIDAKRIFIKSPYIKKTETSTEPKKRSHKKPKEDGDRKLDPEIDGSKMTDSDFIATRGAEHSYEGDVPISKTRSGVKSLRKNEDENTKIYELKDDKLRSTADTGGLNTAKGIEYEGMEEQDFKGELEEFKEILGLLREKPDVIAVNGKTYYLQEGIKGKKFSKLSDGITKRRYAVGEIVMENGMEYRLIEVERENKSLSMLLLYSREQVEWHKICIRVTLGLVEKSGAWDSKLLNELEKNGVYSKRLRHLSDKASMMDKSEHVYEKLYEII